MAIISLATVDIHTDTQLNTDRQRQRYCCNYLTLAAFKHTTEVVDFKSFLKCDTD